MAALNKAGREIAAHIETGGDLSREELVALWVKAFGHPPPRGVQRGLIELGVAWHMQVKEFGGHSPSVNRQLKQMVAQRQARWRDAASIPCDTQSGPGADSTGRPDVAPPVPSSSPRPAVPALAPGTRLVREWHGTTHHVEVIEEGFVFEGRTHASLSAIARLITGARWSGPRFFGLVSLGKGEPR